MADTREWLTSALQAVAPGLKNVVPEVGSELKRLGVQGSMELASALFTGSAFVPYGPGQYPPAPEPGPAPAGPQAEPQPTTHEHERGGMER